MKCIQNGSKYQYPRESKFQQRIMVSLHYNYKVHYLMLVSINLFIFQHILYDRYSNLLLNTIFKVTNPIIITKYIAIIAIMNNNNQVKHKLYDDHYRIKKLLGQGSCGVVLKSVNKSDNRAYAVKLFQMRSIDLQNISYEAQAMMRAKSDYTVQLLDHFYDEDQQKYALVMPYYNKGNLTNFMKKQWSRIDILCFLFQICQAFLSFDRKGACWHLDLKPDNILVKMQGEYLICDFGCAKLVDNINHSKFLEMSINRGVGTQQYAAPELLFEMKGSRFSDIWSLGIILYKILYKCHPFQPLKSQIQNLKKYIKMPQSFKINYDPKPGYQDIIRMCKQMLQPQKRLQWQQLRRKIYESLSLPLQVQIVTDISKFINYVQNVSRIVMGLVYYVEKNVKVLEKYQYWKQSLKIIESCKVFMSMLYKQVQRTIQNKNPNTRENKAQIHSFYIFPQTQQNYTYQQKQKLQYLSQSLMKYCQKQYNEHINYNYYNIKMSFQSDIEEYLLGFKNKGLDKYEKLGLNPIYEFEKIFKILGFIVRENHQKGAGLEFGDRNVIENFALVLLYQ